MGGCLAAATGWPATAPDPSGLCLVRHHGRVDADESMAELLVALDEVARLGAPAQRDQAQALLDRLSAPDREEPALAHARLLVDAYRNDPYLWR